jgi:chloramphenicol-sensitive protein RarD
MMQEKNTKQGIISAIGAYFLWGILPIYWKLILSVPAHEILAHRILWAFLFMMGMAALVNRKKFYEEMKQLVFSPKKLIALIMGSIFISINWFIYIWAVNHDRIVEASLGYYINPLFSVLLGVVFLKERLVFWQTISVVMAGCGVLYMTIHFGSVPWVALMLAACSGLYGLCKKIPELTAITSMTLETLVLTPFAFLYLMYLDIYDMGSFAGLSVTSILLIGSGIVTAIPLLLFTDGANKLSLASLGFFQYLSPTISLLLGVFLYHESFTKTHFISFFLIWCAVILFSVSKTALFPKIQMFVSKKRKLKGGSLNDIF